MNQQTKNEESWEKEFRNKFMVMPESHIFTIKKDITVFDLLSFISTQKDKSYQEGKLEGAKEKDITATQIMIEKMNSDTYKKFNVSAWREYGKRMGYWDYFEQESFEAGVKSERMRIREELPDLYDDKKIGRTDLTLNEMFERGYNSCLLQIRNLLK